MTTRTKWLLVGCLAVFGLYMVDSLYRNWIEQPTAQLTARIDGLNDELQKTTQDKDMAQRVGKRLEMYGQRALPYDPQLARSVYQEWLLHLVDKHQFKSAAVDPGQPMPVEIRSRTKRGKRDHIGSRINYSLRGQASLAQLERLLQDFRRAGHLHKIRTLSLNPTGKEGELDVNLAIEVLSLDAAAKKDELGSWRLITVEGSASDAPSDFVRRNLFARGFAKSLNEIKLKAITSDKAGRQQAWFSLPANRHSVAVGVDENLPLPLHEITVIEILPGRVLVRVNANPLWLDMGQSIGSVLMPPDSPASTELARANSATP
jgi:hypothetical protein